MANLPKELEDSLLPDPQQDTAVNWHQQLTATAIAEFHYESPPKKLSIHRNQ